MDGVSHAFQAETDDVPDRSILIRYNPADPADYRIEAILAPVWCITFGAVLSGSLFFLAYQFR